MADAKSGFDDLDGSVRQIAQTTVAKMEMLKNLGAAFAGAPTRACTFATMLTTVFNGTPPSCARARPK